MKAEPFQLEDGKTDNRLMMWPLGQVKGRRDQMRQTWNTENLESLANSIREMRELGLGNGSGILQPPSVRFEATAFRADGSIKPDAIAIIIQGESRVRAAELSGLEPTDLIPVLMEDANRNVIRAASLHENIHRSDPEPMEIARELSIIKNQHKLTQAQLVEKVGKPRSWVQRHLDLMSLEDDTRELLTAAPDSMQVAARINTVKEPTLRKILIEMRKQGASMQGLNVLIPIRDAPQPLRGLLIVWLGQQWKGVQRREEKPSPEEWRNALRREALQHGFVLDQGLKNFFWRPVEREVRPMLSDGGEFTGHQTKAPKEEEVVEETKPTPAQQWQQLNTNRESRTITVPRLNPRETLSAMVRQMKDLCHAIEGVESLEGGADALRQLEELERAMVDARELINARFSQRITQ